MSSKNGSVSLLLHESRGLARNVVRAAVGAADPARALRASLRWIGPQAFTFAQGDDASIQMTPGCRCILLGVGKAAAPMTVAALEHIKAGSEEHSISGVVVTKYEHASPEATATLRAAGIEVLEAGHPVPDEAGEVAARKVLEAASSAAADDVVILLLSGGGSALLPLPADGLTLADMQQLNRALLAAGASIDEMNALRKHCSSISGGRLAAACPARTLLTLALSDVVGDRLDVIASGPTVPDPSTFAECDAILARYPSLAPALPPAVLAHLAAGAAGGPGAPPETPKPHDPAFAATEPGPGPGTGRRRRIARVIGSNALALRAAAGALEAAGVQCLTLTSRLQGEAAEAAKMLLAVAQDTSVWAWRGRPLADGTVAAEESTASGASSGSSSSCSSAGSRTRRPHGRPRFAVLAGGETTVTLSSGTSAVAAEPGKGGRNQEMALAALIAAAAGDPACSATLPASVTAPTAAESAELEPADASHHAVEDTPDTGSMPFGRGDIGVLCLGTDGSDGPTDAAGAFVPSVRAVHRACMAAGLSPHSALARHDAYTFFDAASSAMSAAFRSEEAATGEAVAGAGAPVQPAEIAHGGLVRTGATGTNVCDITVFLVY